MVAHDATWGTPFVEPESLNNSQLMFVTLIYAVVLYQSSNLISNGSEYLLLIPALAGIVGSIVLPILGAIPDGMMTLCSGLGPDAQTQVSAGVGVLAGSTVMLLTFPWFIACVCGRVPLSSNKEADYGRNREHVFLSGSGVTFKKEIPKGAKIMLITTLLYFIVQIPASLQEQRTSNVLTQSAAESRFALIGMIAAGVFFMAYLLICYFDANEDLELNMIIQCIKDRTVSLRGALASASSGPTGVNEKLIVDNTRLKKILRPFFNRYDEDHNQELDVKEFESLLRDLGESTISHEKIQSLFAQFDKSGNNLIDFKEAVQCVESYLNDPERAQAIARATRIQKVVTEGAEAEEEDEIPEDLADLSPAEQRRAILLRASWMMLLGTFLVLVFSDPLVDCLGEWGRRFDISPFYVAFVVAPFASNASELLSAYNYASKKTSGSITTSLSTLLGAACMNNTFVLGIFFALMYFKELAWQFTAETIAIVVVQWIIGIIALVKKTHTPFIAVVVLAMYPACLFLVSFLENTVGLD